MIVTLKHINIKTSFTLFGNQFITINGLWYLWKHYTTVN